jgi:hypothetical protein
VNVGDGNEWCAMPRLKEERGDTKAWLNSVTVVEERISKATRSHGGVLRSRVAAGAEVFIVPCRLFLVFEVDGRHRYRSSSSRGRQNNFVFCFWFDFNIGIWHRLAQITTPEKKGIRQTGDVMKMFLTTVVRQENSISEVKAFSHLNFEWSIFSFRCPAFSSLLKQIGT